MYDTYYNIYTYIYIHIIIYIDYSKLFFTIIISDYDKKRDNTRKIFAKYIKIKI